MKSSQLACAVTGLLGIMASQQACSPGDPGRLGDGADASPADGAKLDAHVVQTSCGNEELHAGCVARSCALSATGDPLPPGASVTVTETPLPGTLTGDTLAPFLCSVAVHGTSRPVHNLVLSMALDAPPPAAAVLFSYVSPVLSELVPTSSPSGAGVVGLVAAPGDFGATAKPGPWSLTGSAGVDVSSSATEADLVRNLSSNAFAAAYFDGSHLFASNGTRVLIYDCFPANPGVPPAVVLGQPDLDTTEPQVSSSLFGLTDGVAGLWSDGTRLVVAHGNRVLIWSTLPTASFTPADIVLGQPDFESNSANNGGVSSTSLADVGSIDSNGTELVAADLANSRVMVWKTFPTVLDQPADYEVGQPTFATRGAFLGAVPIYQAWGVALHAPGLFVAGGYGAGLVHVPPMTASNPASDFTALPLGEQPASSLGLAGNTALLAGGGLATADMELDRIAVLSTTPVGPVPSIDFVLGQPDTTRVVESLVSASLVNTGLASAPAAVGAGKVLTVPDSDRLLVFDPPPTYNFEPASGVIGQAGFSTNGEVDYRGISASTLAGPADVAASGGTLAVADRGNNRVLLFTTSGITSNGAAATVVLGQPDMGSYVANADLQTPGASTLSGPAGLALDGTHLIVADTENHRVLIWNSVPTTSGAPADLVLGQTDFTAIRPNSGRGDTDGDGFSDAGPDGFFYPMGVASDGVHLFVVDRMNHRVLTWSSFPTTNGQAADGVLGQPSFTSVQSNAGNGPFAVVANGLNLPTGATLAGSSLWVADTENNRLVRWDSVTTTPTPAVAIGQANLTSVSAPNYEWPGVDDIGFATTPPTATASVLRPRAVAIVGGVLFATEMDSNRVHMFDATSSAPLGELGQAADSAGTPDTGGVTAATMSLPLGAASDGTHLWVADSGNHRLLAFGLGGTPATGASAALVLGQVSLLTNGFNQSSDASNGVTSMPHGLATSGDQLYIADTGHSRVLVMSSPVASGNEPVAIYGQPNGSLALPNAGGAASATTLNEPRGVYLDGSHVLVADTANHRVLVYPQGGGATAVLVLGQPDFTSVTANAGGPGAATMQSPAGVYSDGESLWVADTGNHRVLGWSAFPSTNGQPADVVVGQASFSAVLGNHGGADASATSLSLPSDVKVVHGALYIADSGNNRVLSYATLPTGAGAAADGVLGQPTLTSRVAAVVSTDLTLLAGPAALASDPQNLYVADRDLGRVVAYRLGTLASGGPAAFALGPAGGLELAGPSGVAAQRTGLFRSQLYVSNMAGNDIDVLASVDRLAAP